MTKQPSWFELRCKKETLHADLDQSKVELEVMQGMGVLVAVNLLCQRRIRRQRKLMTLK